MTELRTEDIYEAAFDSEHLQRLPDLLAAACGARSSIINWFHPDGTPESMYYSYFPKEQVNAYLDNFTDLDPWVKVGLEPKYLNSVVVADAIVGPSKFERSLMYNEFFRKFDDDTCHCMGLAFRTEWGSALIGLHNGRAVEFGEANQAKLTRIMPHLGAALAVRGQLAGQAKALRTAGRALDCLATAVIVVHADGKLVRSNAAAEEMLRRGDVLTLVAGRLVAPGTGLDAAVAQATQRRQPAATVITLGVPDGSRLVLNVVPLGGGEAALLFRGGISDSGGLEGLLRTLFGLTRGEAQVAVELAAGRSPLEVAASREVSINTLKTQAKIILSKTECRRQTELVALVSRLAQARGAGSATTA